MLSEDGAQNRLLSLVVHAGGDAYAPVYNAT